MKKILYIILAFLVINVPMNAQPVKSVKGLKQGDTLPDLMLNYSIGGIQKTMNTRDLRGKLIIFDFWNIWCSSCISAMPKMAALQEEFGSKIQVILVTNNSQKQVDDQFRLIASKSQTKKGEKSVPVILPSITGDSQLHEIFPHIGVPHHVWVDRNGKVKYIAGGYDASSASIRKVVNGEDIVISEKTDTGDFDFGSPLYMEGNGRQLKNLQAYSMLYKEASEYPNTKVIEEEDSSSGTYRFRCYNFSLLSLYQQPTIKTHGRTFFSPNRILLEVGDSSRFFWPKDESKIGFWRKENLYCYDLSLPLARRRSADEIMFSDLKKFLPYQVSLEKRKTRCLAVVTLSGTGTLTVRHQIDQNSEGKQAKGSFKMNSGTIEQLVKTGLSSLNLMIRTPIVDDTGFKGKLDIYLSSRTDIEIIRNELRSQGLGLIEKDIDLDMLVIRDTR